MGTPECARLTAAFSSVGAGATASLFPSPPAAVPASAGACFSPGLGPRSTWGRNHDTMNAASRMKVAAKKTACMAEEKPSR